MIFVKVNAQNNAEVIRRELKTVLIVVDHERITCHYHQAAEMLHQQKLWQLKESLLSAEYQILKGSVGANREKPDELKPEERQVLACTMIQEAGCDVGKKRILLVKVSQDYEILFRLMDRLRPDAGRRYWIREPRCSREYC